MVVPGRRLYRCKFAAMKNHLLLLFALPVFSATIGQQNSSFSASVAPQAKLDVPGALVLDEVSASKHTIRVYQIVKPSGTTPVTLSLRLAADFDGEIFCQGSGGTGAWFSGARLSTAWTQIAKSESDVSEFSGMMSCGVAAPGSQKQVALEWRYDIGLR